MVASLSLFPARIRFVNGDGTLTPEAWRALQGLMHRVGGPVAPTIQELDAQGYADAGIEETRALLFSGLDDLSVFPPEALPPGDDLAFPPLDLSPLLAGMDALASLPPPGGAISAFDQVATEINGLRETVASLQSQINDLKQGAEL